MKYFQLSIIIGIAVITSSCATMLTGSSQRVTIDSTPKGADIIIDGRMMGTTPSRVILDRDINTLIDNGKYIQLVLPGYISDGYYLGADIEPTTILNFFCPPGFALDAVTGAIMKYDNNYYNFSMVPQNGSAAASSVQQAGKYDTHEVDDYEKLMKLVDLYEDGLITKEEFEAEKATILNKNRE